LSERGLARDAVPVAQCDAFAQAELRRDVPHVELGRVCARTTSSRDLRVGQAMAEQMEHAPLARRERVRVRRAASTACRLGHGGIVEGHATNFAPLYGR